MVNVISKMYKQNIEHVHLIKNFILISGLIFVLFLVLGITYSVYNTSQVLSIIKFMEEQVAWMKEMNQFQLMVYIFLNNALKAILLGIGIYLIEILAIIYFRNRIKAIIMMIIGICFEIFPFIFISVNGLFLGFITATIAMRKGIPFVLAYTVPHGIIEIPIIIIAMAACMKIGYGIISKYRDITIQTLWKEVKVEASFFGSFIVPILFIAAMVEVFITPIVGKALFGL